MYFLSPHDKAMDPSVIGGVNVYVDSCLGKNSVETKILIFLFSREFCENLLSYLKKNYFRFLRKFTFAFRENLIRFSRKLILLSRKFTFAFHKNLLLLFAKIYFCFSQKFTFAF
jgi:hypothetical protein